MKLGICAHSSYNSSVHLTENGTCNFCVGIKLKEPDGLDGLMYDMSLKFGHLFPYTPCFESQSLKAPVPIPSLQDSANLSGFTIKPQYILHFLTSLITSKGITKLIAYSGK